MKIILLFDGLDGKYREYTLPEDIDRNLRDGGRVVFTFGHPDTEEYAKAEKEYILERKA